MKPGWYPVAALGVLAAVDGFHGYALVVLAPDIGRTLGLPASAVGSLVLVGMLCAAGAALPVAEGAARAGRRAAAAVGAGWTWAAGLAATAFVTGPWALAGLIAADGASSGATRALHPALLSDLYGRDVRVRRLAAHRALAGGGAVLAPAVVAGLSAAGLSWRGVYLGLAAIAALAALVAMGVRDPARSRRTADPTLPGLGIADRAREVLSLRSVRAVLLAYAVAGFGLAPLIGHLVVFLEAKWGLGPAGRGVFFAATGAGTLLLLSLYAGEAERRLAQGPGAVLRAAAVPAALAAAALAAAVAAPWFTGAVAAFCAAFGLLALTQVGVMAAVLTIVSPAARTCASALAGIALAGIGGVAGLLLVAGLADALGEAAGVAVLALPVAAAALGLRSAAATADRDAAVVARRLADANAVRRAHGRAGRRPLLECRALEAGYGGRPVLRGIDLAVRPGEVVAVLGTNGAGKTTLLRALSGLLLPAAGSVHLDGLDVTFVAPERRARMGLVHVSGAAAAFPGITVREHLHLLRAEAVAGRLDGIVPLTARGETRAERLSGGERQVLGLAVALRGARVVLTDEPTRNLAPEPARRALAALGEMAARGGAVIIVEQALGAVTPIAHRALFLERGEVRFDGDVDALSRRGDLLRPVFLGAAARSPFGK